MALRPVKPSRAKESNNTGSRYFSLTRPNPVAKTSLACNRENPARSGAVTGRAGAAGRRHDGGGEQNGQQAAGVPIWMFSRH